MVRTLYSYTVFICKLSVDTEIFWKCFLWVFIRNVNEKSLKFTFKCNCKMQFLDVYEHKAVWIVCALNQFMVIHGIHGQYLRQNSMILLSKSKINNITLNNNNFKTSASIFLSLELTSVWAHPAPTEWERKAQRDEGFSLSLSKMATTESKAESLPKCRANLYTMTWHRPEGAQSLNWAHVRGLVYASSGERVPLVRIHRWPFWWTSEYEPYCRKQIAHEGGCDLSKKIQLIRRLQSKATAVFAACVHSLRSCCHHVLLCSHSSSLLVMIFLDFVCSL